MRLELRGVTAGYADNLVLRDVSLTVPTATVVALLGANGAGKTTLLSVAMGSLRPRAGEVCIDREPVTHQSVDRRSRLGVCHIPEGRSIYPALTVRDNIRVFAERRSESEARELAITAFPRLGQRLDQIAGTLSGGEQQMLALARAYVRPSPLVLLDEVSMGLAPIVVDEIYDFLALLRQGGRSVLLVEQYVGRALAVADQVYLLARGRITFAGEPAELDEAQLAQRYLGQNPPPTASAPPARSRRARALPRAARNATLVRTEPS